MLNFKIDKNTTVCEGSGTHLDMVTEAIVLEAQLNRFVYRLGPVEYLVFLAEMQKITSKDDFLDFLQSSPAKETRISILNLDQRAEKDEE